MTRVILVDPAGFEVQYAINPHMTDATGALNQVDRLRARRQWEAVRDAIAASVPVEVLPAVPGAPDAVFCANPCLPVPARVTGGAPHVIPSRMMAAARQPEVAPLVAALVDRGFVAVDLPATVTRFEGMGDGLWNPGRALLWGGVGPRTQAEAWRAIAAWYPDVEVVPLTLVDPDFYHLDMVLCPIGPDTALWFPDALDAEARDAVVARVPDRIEVPEAEARRGFACNAYCPDGRRVVIQRGNAATERALRQRGYEVVPVDTRELMKAGGSVFCMKLAVED